VVAFAEHLEDSHLMPRFTATPTTVGSFPHPAAPDLVDDILRRFSQMPAWPQLPARDWRESMYVQYSEGLPGAVLDARTERIWFEKGPTFDAALEQFYGALVEEEVDRFAISPDYAAGLHSFLQQVSQPGMPRPQWLKGQVTGPFSFAMTVTDQAKRALAYTPDLYEIATHGMALKARWMARRLRADAGTGALVVLDEPYLSSFGSAFVNVSREDVTTALDEAIAGIHAEGALAGIHCCGNTDWSLVLSTQVDVVNFDAYQFFGGLPLYPAELRAFMDRGGILSWGIVPTSGPGLGENAAILLDAIDERAAQLEGKGIAHDRIFHQMLLTPSCGMGTLSVPEANRVLDTLLDVARTLQLREGA
jgi:methionine synthase II (cobalamin-independent)